LNPSKKRISEENLKTFLNSIIFEPKTVHEFNFKDYLIFK